MKPEGLFGPGETSRAMMPATKPTMMTQIMPLIVLLSRTMREIRIDQIRPDTSFSVGSRPSGVRWSTTCGRYWLSPGSSSSRDIPLCEASDRSDRRRARLARSPGEIALFGPLPTQELAVSPWPPCCNCLSRSPSPPLRSRRRPRRRRAGRPAALQHIAKTSASTGAPPRAPPMPPPEGAGRARGAAPGWLPVKCLTAFQASSAEDRHGHWRHAAAGIASWECWGRAGRSACR